MYLDKCGTSRSEVTVNYALQLKLRILSLVIPFTVNSAASFDCPISANDIQVCFRPDLPTRSRTMCWIYANDTAHWSWKWIGCPQSLSMSSPRGRQSVEEYSSCVYLVAMCVRWTLCTMFGSRQRLSVDLSQLLVGQAIPSACAVQPLPTCAFVVHLTSAI